MPRKSFKRPLARFSRNSFRALFERCLLVIGPWKLTDVIGIGCLASREDGKALFRRPLSCIFFQGKSFSKHPAGTQRQRGNFLQPGSPSPGSSRYLGDSSRNRDIASVAIYKRHARLGSPSPATPYSYLLSLFLAVKYISPY